MSKRKQSSAAFELMLWCLIVLCYDALMRTTITLDRDVAQAAKAATARLGKPFKHVVNQAMRIGLEHMNTIKAKPYRTKPFNTKLRPGLSLDNIGELLAQVEGEDYK